MDTITYQKSHSRAPVAGIHNHSSRQIDAFPVHQARNDDYRDWDAAQHTTHKKFRAGQGRAGKARCL